MGYRRPHANGGGGMRAQGLRRLGREIRDTLPGRRSCAFDDRGVRLGRDWTLDWKRLASVLRVGVVVPDAFVGQIGPVLWCAPWRHRRAENAVRLIAKPWGS